MPRREKCRKTSPVSNAPVRPSGAGAFVTPGGNRHPHPLFDEGASVIAAKPNPRRANGHRRNQVIRRVKAEETHCWLCGLEVNKSFGLLAGVHSQRCRGEGCTGCVPHPMRAEVDEVVPVSLGGSAIDRTNCRLSHRRCNLRRGNGTKSKPIIKPVITQRRWW